MSFVLDFIGVPFSLSYPACVCQGGCTFVCQSVCNCMNECVFVDLCVSVCVRACMCVSVRVCVQNRMDKNCKLKILYKCISAIYDSICCTDQQLSTHLLTAQTNQRQEPHKRAYLSEKMEV